MGGPRPASDWRRTSPDAHYYRKWGRILDPNDPQKARLLRLWGVWGGEGRIGAPRIQWSSVYHDIAVMGLGCRDFNVAVRLF